MADPNPPAEVSLTIPSRAEYVGVARLAILGVASRMRFSYDEVEDIRLAVGEACTRSIDRLDPEGGSDPIDIRCIIDPNRLTIEVTNPVGPDLPASEPAAEEMAAIPDNPDNLSGVLIRILMDDVEIEERQAEGKQVVRMVKYVAR